MQDVDFAEIVTQICKEDTRYDRKAYEFVRQGLDYTVKELRKAEKRTDAPRHVSGPELVQGLRTYAIDQYGPLAKTVLNAWGFNATRDFGEVVFNLIEYKVFKKTERDRREDFDDLFTFDDAFVKPFLPSRRPRGGSSPASGAIGFA